MYCEEKIQLKDAFWGEKVHLIREKELPYQWEALNDRIEGADKSSVSYTHLTLPTKLEV